MDQQELYQIYQSRLNRLEEEREDCERSWRRMQEQKAVTDARNRDTAVWL